MRLWGISKRNLKELYRDPIALGFLLGMPIAFILIFSFAFGGQESRAIEIAIADEDQSQISAAYVTFLQNIPALEIVSPIYQDQAAAEAELNAGKSSIYLLIPEGFGDTLVQGEAVNLSLAYNQIDPVLPQRVMPVVSEATLGFLGVAVPLSINLIGRDVEIEDEYVNNLIPGMAVFGLMILITSVAGIMVRDRVKGFLSRLKTTPARPEDFILGYTLPFVPVILVSIAIYLGVGVLMGLTMVGNWGLAFLVLFIVGLCCLGIAMIVATLAKSEEQASGAPWIFIVPVAMISGAWWSAEQMPSIIKGIAQALPFSHAMDATREIVTRGAGLSVILTDIYWLAGWTITLFVLGVFLFRRNMAR